MCIVKTPKITAPTASSPPIEAPTFGNEELKTKNQGKGLKIGTKQLQVPLAGTSSGKSGLSISTKK